MPRRKEGGKFQWDSETLIPQVIHSPSLHGSIEPSTDVSLIHASQLLIHDDISINSLHIPPFTALSLPNLRMLRDNAFHSGMYPLCIKHDKRPIDIARPCLNELRRLTTRRQAKDRHLHESCFRTVVLFSLLSPTQVIDTLFEWMYDHRAKMVPSISFVHDIFLSLGNAPFYHTSTPSAAFLHTIFRKLSSATQDRRVDIQSRSVNLLTLLLDDSHTNLTCPLDTLTCIEYLVHPLVNVKSLAAASAVMNGVKEYVTGQDLESSPRCMQLVEEMIFNICSLTSQQHRRPQGDNGDATHARPVEHLHEAIVFLKACAQCFPPSIVQNSLRKAGSLISWEISLHLLRDFATAEEYMVAVKEEMTICLRKTIQESEGTAIDACEYVLILCVTLSVLPHELQKILDNALDVVENEQSVSKWITAISRQMPLMTAMELLRLFDGRLAVVLHTVLPKCIDNAMYPYSSKPWVSQLFTLQLGLQAVVVMEHATKPKSCSSTDPSLRACRAICQATGRLAIREMNGSIDVQCVSACVMLLLLFVTRRFEPVPESEASGRGACTDIVTVLLLDLVRKVGAKGRPRVDDGAITSLTKVINDFTPYDSSNICSAALSALFSTKGEDEPQIV